MARGISVSRRGLCGAAWAVLVTVAAQADPLALWDFEFTSASTSTRAPTETDPNVVVGSLTLGSGIGTTGEADAFGGDDFRDGMSDPPSYEEALADNEYVTFTIKAATDYTLSLSGFGPYNVKHNTFGPTSGTWEYALDGATFEYIAGVYFGGVTGNNGNDMDPIDLSGISALQELTAATTVTFRLVIYDASGTNGDWYFNGHETPGGGPDDSLKTFTVLGAITPAALIGDLNGDGFVGQDDLNIVLGAWGTNVTPGDPLAGDPSGDGFVGQDDLNDVLAGWGQGTPPSFTVVPEPASAALLALGATAWCRRRNNG